MSGELTVQHNHASHVPLDNHVDRDMTPSFSLFGAVKNPGPVT